jgi:hypothetical protein
MSSVLRQKKQILPNALYINLTSLTSTIVDSNNNVVPWLASGAGANYALIGQASTAGALVLRDMGKMLYRPDPTVPSGVGAQSTIFRRVQVVTTGGNTTQGSGGYYGTGDGAPAGTGSENDYYCGYISLGAQTFGGGNGIPTGVGRLN